MPPTAFIPDGEPHVFEYNGEKRLFVYGSRDERITGYCGYGHDVWSAPVEDLSVWTNHGEIFHVKQVWDIGYGIVEEQHFGAPDCVYNPKTKKYYLYTFLGAKYKMNGKEGPLASADNYIPGFEDYGPKCVMASSDSPLGPFVDPVICDWPPANDAGTFDPSVLVDEQSDGSIRVYGFWGMKKGDRWAELDPDDMHTIIDPITKKPNRNAWQETLDPNLVKNSTLFEASSIKKIDESHYVFIYSSNELWSALTYCYSSSPQGPWTYGGKIVQNDIDWKEGNNHGSIAKVLDQWYVVYHKPTFDSKNRQAMIEPISVQIKGDQVLIPQVEMTSQGIRTEGLDAFKRYNANTVCYRTNKAYINSTKRDPAGFNPVEGIDGPETTLGFKYFNFGDIPITQKDTLQLKLHCKISHPVTIQVSASRPDVFSNKEKRALLGEKTITEIEDTKLAEYTIPFNLLKENEHLLGTEGVKGKLAVFISFIGKEKNLVQLVELEFVKGNSLTPNPLYPVRINKESKDDIQVIPVSARAKTSVKIMIPSYDQNLHILEITDAKGTRVPVEQNRKAPYAPYSFNFAMPNAPVTINLVDKSGN